MLLSGSDWFVQDSGDAAVRVPATVPGAVQADLEAAHLLRPITFGAGDPKVDQVPLKEWRYTKRFSMPREYQGKRLTLVFDGVDMDCEVRLNGVRLGEHVGMFHRFFLDATAAAQVGGTNELTVAIRPPRLDEVTKERLRRDPEYLCSMDFTNYLRDVIYKDIVKSPTVWGYDWAPPFWNVGIWKDVWLEASGPARIDWVWARTTLEDAGRKAGVNVLVEVNASTATPAKVRSRVSRNGSEVHSEALVDLKAGTNEIRLTLQLDRPELWWPNGHGAQPLYDLETRVEDAAGVTLHRRTTRFGVREIRWEQVAGVPDDFVHPYRLKVNGQAIRYYGSNLIPPDFLFGRSHRHARLIELAAAAGMNWLRVWGGGVVLPDSILDRADELGVLLSHEFPLANCRPAEDLTLVKNTRDTVGNILRQLRNHPSIAEYTGGNEMLWGKGGLQADPHPVLHAMAEAVAQHDDRRFLPTCPVKGSRHSPWADNPFTHYNYWNGITDGITENAKLPLGRYGEFGTQSPAHSEVWKREIPSATRERFRSFDDPVLARKRATWAVFNHEIWLGLPYIEAMFGKGIDLRTTIDGGQFLGAEGLRYAVDALRCKGGAVGGFSTWDFNEPWANLAGSYQVDYDGRTLMSYDFMKQAIAPVALSLRYDSIWYDPNGPVKADLWIASDAVGEGGDLLWSWLARDRRGSILDRGSGLVRAAPLEARKIAGIEILPSRQTRLGPIFVELRLSGRSGATLAERIYIFGARGAPDAFRGCLENNFPDVDDDGPLADAVIASWKRTPQEDPGAKENLASVRNGAREASTEALKQVGQTASRFPAKNINDGAYGTFWQAAQAGGAFTVELAVAQAVGSFALGWSRGFAFVCAEKGPTPQAIRIETSVDGSAWTTVFEEKNLLAVPGFNPRTTMEIQVPPVTARYVRVTLDHVRQMIGRAPMIDEFEVFAPREGSVVRTPRTEYREVVAHQATRPVTRTTLDARVVGVSVESDFEVLRLELANTGRMTALFCEPHPLIDYRTDLFIENNNCFIPPGETRTIVIKARQANDRGLTLTQTGWRISCWNADSQIIEPDPSVLLAVGRRDRMCSEFRGYSAPGVDGAGPAKGVLVMGNRPDPARVPYLLTEAAPATFAFDVASRGAGRPALLRIHTADQSADEGGAIEVVVNGIGYRVTLPRGLGSQKTQPDHLAYTATASLPLPAGTLQPGRNRIVIKCAADAWATLDALDLVTGGSEN